MQRKNKMLRHIMREGMFYITFQPHSCQSTERLPCVVALPLWYHYKWKLKYQGTFILQIFTFQFTLLKRQLSLLFSEGKIKAFLLFRHSLRTIITENLNLTRLPIMLTVSMWSLEERHACKYTFFMQQIGKDSSSHQAFFFPLQDTQHLGI